jgi:photosystem II stability/assembly factor-like uncharacterized protein
MVVSSDGGLNWSIAANEAAVVRAVIDDGQRFVAVGDQGQIYTSTDGRAWSTLATVASAPSLAGIAHGPAGYVTVGARGALATSPDGTSWTSIAPTAEDAGIDFAAVLFDGQRFVRVGTVHTSGSHSDADGVVQASVDGVNWTTQARPVTVAASLAFHDGEYVLLGGDGTLLSSRDLRAWTPRLQATLSSALSDDGPYVRAITFCNGQFMAVGTNELILASSR